MVVEERDETLLKRTAKTNLVKRPRSTSTPDLTEIPKFSFETVEKLNLYHVILIYERLNKEKSNKYLNYILDRTRQNEYGHTEQALNHSCEMIYHKEEAQLYQQGCVSNSREQRKVAKMISYKKST